VRARLPPWLRTGNAQSPYGASLLPTPRFVNRRDLHIGGSDNLVRSCSHEMNTGQCRGDPIQSRRYDPTLDVVLIFVASQREVCVSPTERIQPYLIHMAGDCPSSGLQVKQHPGPCHLCSLRRRRTLRRRVEAQPVASIPHITNSLRAGPAMTQTSLGASGRVSVTKAPIGSRTTRHGDELAC